MKNFLKYTLASILGFIIASVLGFLILIGIVSALVSSSEKTTVIADNSVLELKLSAPVVDRSVNDPFQDLDFMGFSGNKKIGLDELLSAIKKSKDESKIKGILLRVDQVPSGYAVLEEVRDALIDFKESGKFIYAFSETYSQKGYYIASVADKVFITPEGSLTLSGLSSQPMFFKQALDKLGIEMQVIRHGKFKAAVEPFMLDKMSDENREQVQVYMGSIWNAMLTDISASRNLSVERLNALADMNMAMRKVDILKENSLVDSILYEDQFLDMLREEIGIGKNKGIPVAAIGDFESIPEKREGKGLAKDKIAVIYASGDIVDNSSGSGMTDEEIVGRDIAREIRIARTDSSIKAIVLRVNSPGGSALASELIWRETVLAKQAKPFIVSMGNLAASGGYYISCAADTIVASPSTITGSIGVFGLIPNFEQLLEKKLGIHTDVVNTNKLSDFPAVTRSLSADEEAIMQGMVEDVYTTFVNHVAEGRKMTYEQVDAIGQGRVWAGANALELGLVDVMGDLDDAIEIAKKKAGLDYFRIVRLPEQKDPIQELLQSFTASAKARVIENELGSAVKYYKLLETVKRSEGVMARVPFGYPVD
jgi:protease IV